MLRYPRHPAYGDRASVHLEEVDLEPRAPLIKRHCEISTSSRVHLPTDPDAPAAAFEAASSQYPVFRIVPRR